MAVGKLPDGKTPSVVVPVDMGKTAEEGKRQGERGNEEFKRQQREASRPPKPFYPKSGGQGGL